MTPRAPRTLSHELLEGAATAAFAVYFLLLALRVGGAVDSGSGLLVVLVACGLGYVLADLISGVAHWAGDRIGDERTPFLGPALIAPFREHHADPRLMVEHGLVHLVGNTAVLALPTLAAGHHLLDVEAGSAWTLFWAGLVLSSMGGAVCTNLIHCWVHMESPPRVARLLQRTGLVLTPARHARHHSGSFDRSYCITTGWINGALDALRVWPRLEVFFRMQSSLRSTERPRPGSGQP